MLRYKTERAPASGDTVSFLMTSMLGAFRAKGQDIEDGPQALGPWLPCAASPSAEHTWSRVGSAQANGPWAEVSFHSPGTPELMCSDSSVPVASETPSFSGHPSRRPPAVRTGLTT